jgi:hypothetical protein
LVDFFSGGNLMEYTLNYQSDMVHVIKIGPPLANSAQHGEAGLGTKFQMKIFALGSENELDAQALWGGDHSEHESVSKAASTTIRCVLGDPEVTDYFVVDLFTDPVYGSFVFHTVAGRSMCPHEDGTIAASVPDLRLQKWPVQAVLPDQPMVFRLALGNMGVLDNFFEVRYVPEVVYLKRMHQACQLTFSPS